MLDSLQIAPDILNQVADTTEFFAEPMQAILDSICANTGQTAQNTIRDEEVFIITKKDYYIAVAAIIVAIVSLVVDILTTVFQHISSSNSKLISAKYTLPVQEVIAIDMLRRIYNSAMFILVLKYKLKQTYFSCYPSEFHTRALEIRNHLELEALLVTNPNDLSRYNNICEHFELFNSKCNVVTEHLKSKTISNEIKESDLDSLILTLGVISKNILDILTCLDSEKNYTQMLWNKITNWKTSQDHENGQEFPNDIHIDWHKEFRLFFDVFLKSKSEAEIIKEFKTSFAFKYRLSGISMIDIN